MNGNRQPRTRHQHPIGQGFLASFPDHAETGPTANTRPFPLLDGPVVLGWQTLRAIQEGNSIALINEMVREAIAAAPKIMTRKS